MAKKRNKSIDKKFIPYEDYKLPSYFTKNSSFYYNFDSDFASLFSDLLKQYYKKSKRIIDWNADERHISQKKIIKKAIKSLKNYKKYDWSVEETQVYLDDLKTSLKDLADIWPTLWY